MNSRLPPECLLNIFENFSPWNNGWKSSFKSLHSCILVNREWCEAGLTVLWREPLEWLHSKEENRPRLVPLISTYISCLPQDSKLQILDDGLLLSDSILKPASIDYPSLLRGFDYQSLYNGITFWLTKNLNLEDGDQKINNEKKFLRYQLLKIIISLFMSKCTRLKRFSIFMKAGITDGVLLIPILSGANEFLSNISEFSCKGCLFSDFMRHAAQSCRNIKRFNIECCCTDNRDLVKLIEVQKVPLNCILINMRNDKIPLLENAIRKRAHSITEIRLHGLEYSLDYFKESKNLEKMRLLTSVHINEPIWKKFMNFSFPKLRELKIRPRNCSLSQLGTFIQNTHGSLEYLEVLLIESMALDEFPSFTEVLINNCKNLRYYGGPFYLEGIEMLKSFFQKCPNLEGLILHYPKQEGVDISYTLQKAGSFVPINLDSLKIIGMDYIISAEALKSFLQACATRLCRVLEFKYTSRRPHSQEIESIIEENQNVIRSNYIIKNNLYEGTFR